MGKRKITCNNSGCRHYDCNTDGRCNTCITIGLDGKCESFEKGFLYYFHIVWEVLVRNNFIDFTELQRNPDLRTGLYYVMECYDLKFVTQEWGTWRYIMFENEEGETLKYDDIVKRELNMDKFNEYYEDFDNGIMPEEKLRKNNKLKEHGTEIKEFGWVSPTGEFFESPFGTHEESAQKIVKKKGMKDEFLSWKKETTHSNLMRDFLSEIKGYCLVHNPTGDGGYVVTNLKPLTKKQKEFLYGYFMDMGDHFKAEQYFN